MVYVLAVVGIALLFTLPCLIAEYWSEIKKKFSRQSNTVVNKNQQTIKGEKSMDIELENLIEKYLRDFERKKNLDITVKNSIPVIWFGDMQAYQKSNVKIVTIGLNPSRNEFECYPPRFNTNANTANALYVTLCNYFNDNPLKSWFAQFEKCLKRLNASYGGKMSVTQHSNTAIHIDAYSAISTNPTWGRLEQGQKNSVNQQELCQRLLKYLQPDIVLMSVNHDCFTETLHITRPQCLYYKHRQVEVYEEHGQILVYGRLMKGQPFGGISNELLDEAFNKIKLEN